MSDSIRDALLRIAKDYMASDTALVTLLVEKGLLGKEDVDRLIQLKLGSLASLDQIEAKSLDAIFKNRPKPPEQ